MSRNNHRPFKDTEDSNMDETYENGNAPQTNNSSRFSKTELRRRSRIFIHRQTRIIVRNLPYKITEEKLRTEFKRFGAIEEVNILKRPDGKIVGCAFVQFASKEQSDRAIQEMNSQMFMGRKLQVHYALDKKGFSKMKTEKKIKSEDASTKIEDDDVEIKDEDDDEDEEDDDDDAEDEDEDDDDEDEDEDEDEDGHTDEDEDDEHDEGSEDDGEEEDSDGDDKKPLKDMKPNIKKENKHTDVEEGRTVFVKNVPYDVDTNELKDLMSQFGIVDQVLINRERVSGHSKGTAFVIFKLKDSAQLSCRQNLKLQMRDQFLEIMEALRKKDIKDREKAKLEKRAKDSRNLYLLKEGLIMAGSPAAKDVSKADMSQRLRLEQRSNELLKNFNRFVARERLTMHNIPPGFTNEDLRKVVIKFTSHKPKECRVMRDTRPSFGNPIGKSRGYGFLSFKSHEVALEVLRKLNNNPTVFGKNSRPIVSFSIEDRNVYNIRQKRLEKSRLNNPTYQKKMEQIKAKKLKRMQTRKTVKREALQSLTVAPGTLLQKLHAKTKGVDVVQKKKQRKRDAEQHVTPFTGELSKEGRAGIRSTRKIVNQADAHIKRIKQERKEEKKKRLKQEHARNRMSKVTVRQQPKMNVTELRKENAFFKEAIGKYKDMISKATKAPTRSKWYSE